MSARSEALLMLKLKFKNTIVVVSGEKEQKETSYF